MSENRRKLYILLANSFILYILAFLVIHIPSQFFTHLVARAFDIPTKFHNFKIAFPIPDHSYLWTSNSVAAIYVTAPIISFLIAIFVARYYVLYSAKKSINTNLFLIWVYAHCINLFFGGLTIGIPLVKGFGYVPAWLYASDVLMFILILISLLILFGNGFVLRNPFTSLYFNNQYFNSPFHSLVFKVFIAIIPFFLVNLLFYIFKFPDNSIYERLTGITMIIQLVGIVPYSPVYQPEENQIRSVNFAYKGLMILVVVFLFFVLWKTFHNQIIYDNPEKTNKISLVNQNFANEVF